MANQDWINLIANSNPELVDDCVHHFIDSAKINQCHIILLTARNNAITDLTREHLNKVDLYFEHIYFNENKGDELVRIVKSDYCNCTDIIVIDDKEANLLDIQNKMDLTKYKLHLYMIDKIVLGDTVHIYMDTDKDEDEDMLEIGRFFSSDLDVPFNFIKII